jgi:hypothetical protein
VTERQTNAPACCGVGRPGTRRKRGGARQVGNFVALRHGSDQEAGRVGGRHHLQGAGAEGRARGAGQLT